MLKPSDFIITNFSELAQGQTGLCVGVRPYYKDYKDGIAGEIGGHSYDIELRRRNNAAFSMRVPCSGLINAALFMTTNAVVPIEQIQGFSARWYKTANMTDYSLSCKASGFTISKEAKA